MRQNFRSVLSKYPLIFLTLIFFLFRLLNVLAIPVFNDEAIYLDWGWRETHHANLLFYSLYDAKPPLLMWIFGLVSLVFPTLLLAGRIVAVIFGYLTMLGIWIITRNLFSRRTAFLASILYILIPVFSFFDRQALMESAVGAIGVWSCYLTLKIYQTKKYKWSMLLGLVLGIGYFIKPNSVLFGLPLALIFVLFWLKKTIRPAQIPGHILDILLVGIMVLLPLILQPQFWQSLQKNNGYMLPPEMYLNAPYWTEKFYRLVLIFLLGITPVPLAVIVFGILKIFHNKWSAIRILAIWLIVSLLADIILVKSLIERYLVSFLPLVCVIIAYQVVGIKDKNLRRFTLAGIVVSTAAVTTLQVFSPLSYFTFLSRVYPSAFMEYRSGFSSGYGIPEAVKFLENRIDGKPAFIATAIQTGNPESGVDIYFLNRKNVSVSYLEGSYLKDIGSYDCLAMDTPLYYVSREDDTKGLDRFLERIYFARSPVSGFGIGIYTLKQPCSGKKFYLQGYQT